MKKIYIPIFLLLIAVAANAQSNFAKEAKQKIQEFLQKISSPEQLKSASAEAYALDSVTYENGDVKKMIYNNNGLLLKYEGYKNEDGKIYLNDMETNTYNESGQILTNLISKYDDWEEIVLDQWKYETTYDAQGRITSEIYWDETSMPNELQQDDKVEYEYKENNTIDLFQYTWDNKWELDNKTTMFVKWGAGSTPTIDSMHVYLPVNGSTDNWLLMGNMITKYHAPNLISETLSTLFDEETGAITYKSKTETSYNNNGDILSDVTLSYNPANGEWKTTSKELYEYNTTNQTISEEYFFFNWATDLLEPTTKNTYEYGSDGNLTVLKAYVSDGDNAEEMLLYNRYEFKFNNLNTDIIMLPSSETGYYNNYYDFYEHEFYTNKAIDEVKHYEYEYTSESLELQKIGKYHYSEHNSVATSAIEFDKSSISVFPNPFTNQIKQQLDNSETYLLKISNGMGQVVYTSIVESSSTHNVSYLPSGMYILSLFKNGETKANYKLIKK